jgi:hypothetical protein
MKNPWLHSLCVIALGTLALGLASSALAWAAPTLPDVVHAPAHAFALLGPGLLAGWFTRRHPLLVGAAAGALYALAEIAGWTPLPRPTSPGDGIAIAMIVAVAALAGRALRHRLGPRTGSAT